MSNQKKQYIGLNAIRGMAAILIMLYHYTIRYNENPLTSMYSINWFITFDWGCAAVSTFFILSGFLGSKHLLQTGNFRTVLSFYLNRIVRLYPSFWICLIITAIVSLCFFPNYDLTLKDVVINTTMFPNYLGAKYIDGAYWTLQVEWTFYIISGLLLLLSTITHKRIILGFWLAISIIIDYLCSFYPSIPLIGAISTIVAAPHAQEFLSGVAIFFLMNNKRDQRAWVILLLCFAKQLFFADSAHCIVYIVSLAVIFSIVCFDTENLFRNRFAKILCWYGSLSYPFYLLHQIVGFAIIKTCVENGWDKPIIIVIPFVFITILSYGVHKLIEIPTIDYYKQMQK